jgi:transposase
VSDATTSLPQDPAALQILLIAALAERDAARAEKEIAQAQAERVIAQNDRLRHIIHQLQRGVFGRSSEKLDPDQIEMVLESFEEGEARVETEKVKADGKNTRSSREWTRKSLPAHLARVEVVVEPQDTACPCCGGGMHVIGEEKSERLDVIPAQYRVLVTRRPKYACRACEGTIVQAPAPNRLIEGGLPTEGLVAHIITAKFGDHLPLYRQSQIMARQGIEIDRSTLASWVGTAAAELKPIYLQIRQNLLGSAKLYADETTAPVLDPGRGRTKTGYFWSLARDDRPWNGHDSPSSPSPATGPPAVVYTYAPGRGFEHAQALLDGYSGIVQCDGYAAYKKLADAGHNGGPVTLAFCTAHWRRKFYEVAAKGKPAPIANEALRRIAALYAIEDRIRGRSAEERCIVRQAETRPLIEELKAWLEKSLQTLSRYADTAKAIRYGLSHWNGLIRFIDDGRIEIDTNAIERSMRPIALTRKNALFGGSDQGAEGWAIIASLVECCKLNDVNPEAYFTDVLTKLVNLWPNDRIDQLLPWNWASSPNSQGA